MIVVLGINHARATGINKKTGQARDFDPQNVCGYRSPETPQETAACVAAALNYYNICAPDVRVGAFGLFPASEADVAALGERLILASDFGELLGHGRTCEYCGALFLPTAPRQKVCTRPECQKRRLSNKQAAYQRRVRAKAALDKAQKKN